MHYCAPQVPGMSVTTTCVNHDKKNIPVTELEQLLIAWRSNGTPSVLLMTPEYVMEHFSKIVSALRWYYEHHLLHSLVIDEADLLVGPFRHPAYNKVARYLPFTYLAAHTPPSLHHPCTMHSHSPSHAPP